MRCISANGSAVEEKMNKLISVVVAILMFSSCGNPEKPATEKSTTIVERDFTINTATEIGHEFGEGELRVSKLKNLLALDSLSFSQTKMIPDAMRVLFVNVAARYDGKMFQFPLTVGKTWKYRWDGETQITIENPEDIEIAAGTFPNCLKHKSVLIGADNGTELEHALINGTRYLWFAKGVGLVKMRYEHSNGIITEAELIEHNLAKQSKDYFPVSLGSTWTYKWKNNYYNEVFFENVTVGENRSKANLYKGKHELKVIVSSENGEMLGQRDFYVDKTKRHLGLRQSSSRQGIKSSQTVPNTTSLFFGMIGYFYGVEIFKFPITVGKSWTYQGPIGSEAHVTVEPYEQVELSTGTYQKCLKHKTVFKGESSDTDTDTDLVNGTRYLWFAKGVGLVKMRYEHSNGTVTEAELIEYSVQGKSEEYLPLNLDTTWTYKWQNDYFKPIIEKIKVVEAGSGHETPFQKAQYTVIISDDQPGEAQVVCKLTPKKLSGKKIRLRTDGRGYYIPSHTVKIKDSSNRIPNRRSGNWEYEFRKPYKSPLTLTYNVSLKHDEETRGYLESREGSKSERDTATFPYLRPDCTFWTGYHLFIIGGTNPDIEVEFDLPKGWRVSTPWKRLGKTRNKFSVKNQRELTDSAILIGQHAEGVAKLGKTEVMLAVGGNLKTSIDKMQNTTSNFLNKYAEMFNGGPTQPVLFIINPFEDLRMDRLKGRAIGYSVSILMNSNLDEETKHLWGPFLGHEVFHIWNGITALKQFSLKEHWFLEGITSYYTEIASVDMGYITEQEFFERLERTCESYLSSSSDATIGGSSKTSALGYNGGSVTAISLDLQIRHLTENRKHLDHVMQQLYQKFGNIQKKYTQRDVIDAVNKVSKENFEPFFKTYVTGKERFPLSEYFNYAGLDVQIEYSEELPTTDYIIDVLKTSLQKEKWRLISVNGVKVNAFADLRESAKSWKSGDALTVTIEENDETLTLPVTLSGIFDNPPTTRDVSVRITKKAETNRLQRAILAGILGNN